MAAPNTHKTINIYNLTGSLLELVLANIAECLTVAGLYGGNVFGGYVRDVVVPRLIDPECHVKFSDVDIWFTNKRNADEFVEKMGQKLKKSPFSSVGEHTYQFERTLYNFYCGNIFVAYIKLVISEVLPVDDFDINSYYVPYINNMPVTTGLAGLVGCYESKLAHMLPYYFELLNNPSTNETHYRRVRELLAKGWRIVLGDSEISISKNSTNGSSEFFTREWLLARSRERQPSATVKPNNQVTITSDQNLSEVRTLCRNSIVSLNTLMDKLKSMNL